ncbi:MAG TPA: hypothetical protein VIL01_11270 [Thermomicrobiales bacterium]
MASTATHPTTSFTCKNCGATTAAVAQGTSIRCPFCGSEHVIAGPDDPEVPKPEALIPFSFPDTEVERVYRAWLGEGFFRPKDLRDKAVTHKLQAVYVPVWECRGRAISRWTATAGYDREVEEQVATTENGKPATQTRTTTVTDWRPAGGQHEGEYERVLVSGSKGLPQDWLARLGDYDWGALVSYRQDFLLGREVELSALDRTAALERAKKQIESKERDTCSRLVPGSRHKDLRVDTQVTDLAARLLYLPAWLAAFGYNGKTYQLVVNGQSGKVSGEAPVAKGRVAVVIAAIVAVIAVIVLLTAVLS